jgi:hypothetical protein
MYKWKLLVSSVLLVYILFIIFQFSGYDLIASYLRAFILPIVAIIYFITAKEKTLFFSLFVAVFAISDLLGLLSGYIPGKVDYYLGNILYILAYTFLFIEILKSISIRHVMKNFKIHLFVLTILNAYIIYVLQVIVDPYVGESNEYYIELLYNVMMLLLLSAALLNYFYRDNKKAFYLFLGALCIVFSEVIAVAYIYISAKNLLIFLSTSLGLGAFYFFYQQSRLLDLESDDIDILITE